jgi:hypothetical protein
MLRCGLYNDLSNEFLVRVLFLYLTIARSRVSRQLDSKELKANATVTSITRIRRRVSISQRKTHEAADCLSRVVR